MNLREHIERLAEEAERLDAAKGGGTADGSYAKSLRCILAATAPLPGVGPTTKLRELVKQWRAEAEEAAHDYYAGQYDSHGECADELEAALAERDAS